MGTFLEKPTKRKFNIRNSIIIYHMTRSKEKNIFYLDNKRHIRKLTSFTNVKWNRLIFY